MTCKMCGYQMTPDTETAAIRLTPDGWHVTPVHAWCLPRISNRHPARPSDDLAFAAHNHRLLTQGRRVLAALSHRERVATDAITGGYADLLEVGDSY